MGQIDSISPLAADLRTEDADSYLATLFAPAEKRQSLFALYAFSNELSRIRRIVSEPMAGLIRLQWWEDIIDDFECGKSVAHPVAVELERAFAKGDLNTAWLKRAIDGRRRAFEGEQALDIETFKRFLQEVGGSVTSAAAELLGAKDDHVIAVAGRVGLVKAVCEQVRSLGRAKGELRPWLPLAWLNPAGGDGVERTESVVSAEAEARSHLVKLGLAELAKARQDKVSIARSQLAAFFPGTLAGIRMENSLRLSERMTVPIGVPTLIWSWARGRF